MNPVFANRHGTWMSLANLRRALREALTDELRWFTPHSCRRTVATVVKRRTAPTRLKRNFLTQSWPRRRATSSR